MFKTRAIRFIQNQRVFYNVVIPAGELVKLAKVDVWDPDNPSTGYQRAPSLARKREIGRYAMRPDAIMPVGGLANARPTEDAGPAYGTVLKFKSEYDDGDVSFGVLSIPDSALPIYIVDMQHRLGGYEWAMDEDGGEHLSKFPLAVTIADGLSMLEEVDQFDLINTTQKKVRTDLARRLKSIQVQDLDHRLDMDRRGRLWEAKGPVIAQKLNSQSRVWSGRILPPNKSKSDQPTMAVRETSFVTSLKPILQTPYFIRQTEEHAAELISRYWEAIRKVWPEAFTNPDGYVIQKSPGVFSLHELAPEVFELVRDTGEVTTDNIYNVVKCFAEIGGSAFWESKSDGGAALYGSMKGFHMLAVELRQYLPNIKAK
jgi:DGQHR domain-containing protein